MKSKVEQYAKGDFYVEYPEIQLSKQYLQLKIEAGSVYNGSVKVTSSNDVAMKMMVYDDAYLLTLSEHSLVGKKGEIAFSFDATSRKRGSVYDGVIRLIGNGTEMTIPYNIEIVAPFIDVNGVALEDLMKFSALAETDWNKALQTFHSEEFPKTLLAGQTEYLEAYRSLKDSLDKDQALEEFLVYIHKKRALTLQVEHDRFQFRFPKMLEEHELVLRKNTWGYCRMRVYTDARFIKVHQQSICSMDFQEDRCAISYSIDPEQLDENKQAQGQIIIENTYQRIIVNVVVKAAEEGSRVLVHRDHDRRLFEEKKDLFSACADFLNRKYGAGTVVVDLKDSYYNMREIMEPHMHLIDNARAAMEELGIEPKISPIRGGTDGARLSFMGLPCPNLCTGGENYHGRYEYACVQSMEKTTQLLIAIAAKYADR